MSNVRFLGNGLRLILAEIDERENLLGSMKLFWSVYDRTIYVDAILSALFETVNRTLAVAETRTEWIEYKLNFITDVRAIIKGVPFDGAAQIESDVIAQIRWHKSKEILEAETITDMSPAPVFDQLCSNTSLGCTATLMCFRDFSEELHAVGWQCMSVENTDNNGVFEMAMKRENIAVRFTVYVRDYQQAQYLHSIHIGNKK